MVAGRGGGGEGRRAGEPPRGAAVGIVALGVKREARYVWWRGGLGGV